MAAGKRQPRRRVHLLDGEPWACRARGRLAAPVARRARGLQAREAHDPDGSACAELGTDRDQRGPGALVIASGGHRIVVARLLRKIEARACSA
jgi:hypothetical protein